MKTPPPLTKSLICTLSDEERRNYGIQLATTLEEIEGIEAEKKKISDRYKDRIAGLQSRADDIRQKVSSGQEWREVECTVVLCQPTADHKQIVRNDTGEVVGTECMNNADRQAMLPFVEPEAEGVIDVEAEPVEGERNWDEVADPLIEEQEDAAAEESDPDIEPEEEPAEPVVVDDAPRPGPIAEAEAAGRKAFAEGKPITKPPYSKKRVKELHAWAQGWIAAQDEADDKADAANAGNTEPMPENDPEAPAPEGDDY